MVLFDKKINNKELSKDLKEFRLRYGLSQDEIADLLGISSKTVYRIENEQSQGISYLILLGVMILLAMLAEQAKQKYLKPISKNTTRNTKRQRAIKNQPIMLEDKETNLLPFLSGNTMMTGKEVKTTRQVLGISQEKLANVLDVSLSTVQRWESGKYDPALKGIVSLAMKYIREHPQEVKNSLSKIAA